MKKEANTGDGTAEKGKGSRESRAEGHGRKEANTGDEAAEKTKGTEKAQQKKAMKKRKRIQEMEQQKKAEKAEKAMEGRNQIRVEIEQHKALFLFYVSSILF